MKPGNKLKLKIAHSKKKTPKIKRVPAFQKSFCTFGKVKKKSKLGQDCNQRW